MVVGDNVWVTEQINVDGPPGPRPFVYNELTTFTPASPSSTILPGRP